MNTNDLYAPLCDFRLPPIKQQDYYEVRIWRNHILIINEAFITLKAARKYYTDNKLDIKEKDNWCYVEIIHVKPLKKYQ